MSLYNIHWKNVLVGVLVAYVAIDLLLMYTVSYDHPGVIGTFFKDLPMETLGVALLIGGIIGFIAYYLSSKAREYFEKVDVQIAPSEVADISTN